MTHDVIVIGAGHNGLTAACLLAKKGRRVLVLERRDVIGGLCAGEEFHPGYHTAGLLHDTTAVRAGVVDSLRLHEHGLELEPVPAVFVPQAEGNGLLLSHDPAQAAAEIQRVSERDAGSYRDFHALMARLGKVITPLLNAVPPDMLNPEGFGGMLGLARQALSVKRLGQKDMMELMRVPAMCVADWLNEWFETDALKVALSARAIDGMWAGPWSPGTAANLMLWMCNAGRAVKGGPAALVLSLERASRNLGVEVRTGAAVVGILVSKGRAGGVVLSGGEEISAATVVSSCDPKTTFLSLLGPTDISHAAAARAANFRMRGTTAKVNLALNKPLSFASRPDAGFEFIRTGADLDTQERAFDAVKYRRFSERPLLDIYVPDVSRPDRAPQGHSVASILVHFAPRELDGGWTDEQRERLGDGVVSELERVAPGMSSSIVAREVLTPADIEERYGVTGGHIHHGEHALDQLLARPTIDAARYSTPVENLFLCGSGSHPGGGVTCAPGALAAGVIGGS